MARRSRRWFFGLFTVLTCGAVAGVALAASTLTATPDSLIFAGQDTGSTSSAQATVIKNTDASAVTLESISTDNSDFDVDFQAGDCETGGSATVLAQDDECTVHVTFSPQATGSRTGTLTVASSGDDATVGLSGTGTTRGLTASPTSLSFGSWNVPDGASAAQTSTITNTGSSDVAVGTPLIGGADAAEFALASPAVASDCDSSDVLAPGEQCDVRVVFDPDSTGMKNAQVTVPSDAPDVTVGLSGTGTQPDLTRSQDLSFGGQDVDDGATSFQTSVVQNTGDGPATISDVALGGTDQGDYTLDSTGTGDCKAGTVLAPTETCDVRVAFDPTTTGMKDATVGVTSNAAPLSIVLSGEGQQTTLSPDLASWDFGGRDVDDGPAADKTFTFTNSGPKTLNVHLVDVTGADFSLSGGTCVADTTALAPGDSCTVIARFDPTTTGAKSGSVTVTPTAGEAAAASVTLTGGGIQTLLATAPASIAFGNQDIDDGRTTPQVETITNVGTEPVTLTGVTLTGGDFDRLAFAGDCASGTTLNPGDACKVRVRFDPSSTGDRSGGVSVTSNAPEVTIPLSGTGIQTDLARAPAGLEFGTRNVGAGASRAQEATLTNDGTQPIALSGVTIEGTAGGQFKLRGGDAGDCASGQSLVPGATCKVRAAFDPSSKGAKAAVVHVASDAGPDVTVALAGTATPLAKLTLPNVKTKAPKGKRLKLTVVAANGPVGNVVVTLKSGGKLVGSAKVASLSGKRTVTLRLERVLGAGRYVSNAQGRDRFGNTITARPAGKVTLTGATGRPRRPSGGGGQTGGRGGHTGGGGGQTGGGSG